MYILNLRALITDLKKHKLSASDSRKYFWSLILGYSLCLVLPVTFLWKVEQKLLAIILIVMPLGLGLLTWGLSKMRRFFGRRFVAIAFVQLVRILFLVALEIMSFALVMLIILVILLLLHKFMNTGRIDFIVRHLVIVSCFSVLALIFSSIINPKLVKILINKLKVFFDKSEVDTLLSSYRLGYRRFYSGWTKAFFIFFQLILGFAFLNYYDGYESNSPQIIIPVFILVLIFQLFWLFRVNLTLSEIQQAD